MAPWFVDRHLARVALGLSLLMAVARVDVGAHYPAGVLAGFVLERA